MCKRCIIFTYDEVLDIVMKIEVETPLNFNPDWPVRTTEAYPKSVAPLIVPSFDTTTQSLTLMTTLSDALSPTFAPGSLGVRELSWGFEETRRCIQHTHRKCRKANLARIHATPALHSSRPRFLRDASRRNLSLTQNGKTHQTPIRIPCS